VLHAARGNTFPRVPGERAEGRGEFQSGGSGAGDRGTHWGAGTVTGTDTGTVTGTDTGTGTVTGTVEVGGNPGNDTSRVLFFPASSAFVARDLPVHPDGERSPDPGAPHAAPFRTTGSRGGHPRLTERPGGPHPSLFILHAGGGSTRRHGRVRGRGPAGEGGGMVSWRSPPRPPGAGAGRTRGSPSTGGRPRRRRSRTPTGRRW